MAQADESTPETRARKRAKSYTGLMWHIGRFLVINAFFWLLDIATGADGVQWAYWITTPWEPRFGVPPGGLRGRRSRARGAEVPRVPCRRTATAARSRAVEAQPLLATRSETTSPRSSLANP
jgi:hypothetical protein